MILLIRVSSRTHPCHRCLVALLVVAILVTMRIATATCRRQSLFILICLVLLVVSCSICTKR
ncbi:MAG: hypothetical protein J3R72DRAFT_456904 [Linnemannia gamsii]|nr:MAG: hypothetical protein J3R72DRAFT_456904 [Linnemannia gamsii]